MRRTISTVCIWTLLVAAGATAWAADGAATQPVKAHVAILDFVTAGGGDAGAQIAESTRIRLRRHTEYSVLDRLSTQDVAEPTPADADEKAVRELMTRRLGCNYAVYGTVTVAGGSVRLDAKCVDLTDPAKPAGWTKTFSDSSERAKGIIAQYIVEQITGQAEWKPPEYGQVAVPANFGKPLNINGDFEQGRKGWDAPDNCASFLVAGPAGHGTILRIRTDIPNDPWLEYSRKLRLGLASTDNPPKLPRDTSYGSVAGLEGVHYNSHFIDATPLWRYWLAADVKSDGTPKIFVKGYRDWSAEADGLPELSLVEMKMSPQDFARLSEAKQKELIAQDAKRHPERYRRECYRWYINCSRENARGQAAGWVHMAEQFPPRGGLPDNVRWLQIQIYPYWPPTEYLFDNVHLYKDPGQTTTMPEEKPRTPNFGKTSDVVERE